MEIIDGTQKLHCNGVTRGPQGAMGMIGEVPAQTWGCQESLPRSSEVDTEK